jgi:hypothetical protein
MSSIRLQETREPRNPNGAMLGNTNAKKENRIVGDVLRRIAKQQPKKLRKACEALFTQAAEGDTAAFRELADRLDGKVAAQGSGSGSIKVLILRDNSNAIVCNAIEGELIQAELPENEG